MVILIKMRPTFFEHSSQYVCVHMTYTCVLVCECELSHACVVAGRGHCPSLPYSLKQSLHCVCLELTISARLAGQQGLGFYLSGPLRLSFCLA